MHRLVKGILTGALLVLIAAGAGLAEVDVVAVKADFKPAAGYVVMPFGEQYLVDLDAGVGLRPGDLLSVVEKGRNILHPVSGEVLGSLDQVKATLLVTQVKTGYSYARPLGNAPVLKAGEAVRRFEQTKAIFWDYAGGGESLYQDLAGALAHFDWQAYTAAQTSRPAVPAALASNETALLFIHDQQGLSVRNSDFTPLRSYSAKAAPAALGGTPSASGVVRMSGAPVAGQVSAPQAQMTKGGIVRVNQQAQEGVWSGPTVAESAVGIEVAELDGDGQFEVAVAYENYIEISRLSGGKYSPVARVELPRALKALHLDGADLNGDGRVELYVTAANEAKITSLVIEHQAGGYQITIKDIPWYFSVKDLPGEGRVLLAQQSDFREQEDFVGEPFRVSRQGANLTENQVQPIPAGFTLYDYHAFAGTDGIRRVAGLTEGGALTVSMPEGTKLWKSGETMGGSLAVIERYINVNSKSVEGMRPQYLRARISGGPNGEVLVPVNEGSRLLPRLRSFGSSHLRALAWNGSMLQEVWRTQPQSGYLADYRIADADNDGADELIMVVGYNQGGLLTSSRSGVVIYELQ